VVVAEGETFTGVPLVTVRFPGVITPVPFSKTAVRVADSPTVIVVGFASKLAMEGHPLTQPMRLPKTKLKARVKAARFIVTLKESLPQCEHECTMPVSLDTRGRK